MKKLLFIAFLFLSAASFAQVNINNNPYDPVEAGETLSTSVTTYSMPAIYSYSNQLVIVKIPSGNSGTVKFSAVGSAVIASSPAYAAGATFMFEVRGGMFWVQLSNSADTFEISW